MSLSQYNAPGCGRWIRDRYFKWLGLPTRCFGVLLRHFDNETGGNWRETSVMFDEDEYEELRLT